MSVLSEKKKKVFNFLMGEMEKLQVHTPDIWCCELLLFIRKAAYIYTCMYVCVWDITNEPKASTRRHTVCRCILTSMHVQAQNHKKQAYSVAVL